MTDDSPPTAGEWQDWAEVAAADLADPAFRALVEEIDVDQKEWALQLDDAQPVHSVRRERL